MDYDRKAQPSGMDSLVEWPLLPGSAVHPEVTPVWQPGENLHTHPHRGNAEQGDGGPCPCIAVIPLSLCLSMAGQDMMST